VNRLTGTFLLGRIDDLGTISAQVNEANIFGTKLATDGCSVKSGAQNGRLIGVDILCNFIPEETQG
jgi:hypothetical protein